MSKSTLSQIHPSIWMLGFVSLLMDMSSEMIHSLLPLFMVTTLGATALTIGLIEGGAEATALMVKVFSGMLSDYTGKRKWLAVSGYALGAISKPLFALATTSGVIMSARFIDRIGKGIRGATFGLRQSLDTVGAFIGPLLAAGLMLLRDQLGAEYTFYAGAIFGVFALLLIAFRKFRTSN